MRANVPPTALEGVYAKLSRARHHAHELQKLVDDIFEEDRHRFIAEEDVVGVRLYRAVGVPSVSPEISAVLGDFLANMRASLDHLAYQLAMRDGGGSLSHLDPDAQISFPIHESPMTPKGRLRRLEIPGVSDPQVIEAITEVQPYVSERENPAASPLSVLRRLRNIDQHRLLLVVVSVLDSGRMWWGSNDGDPIPRIRVSLLPVMEGEPVAWFDFRGEPPPKDFNPHLELKIRLNHGPRGSLEHEAGLTDLVSMIYSHVEHFVIGMKFSAFFGAGVRHGHSAL